MGGGRVEEGRRPFPKPSGEKESASESLSTRRGRRCRGGQVLQGAYPQGARPGPPGPLPEGRLKELEANEDEPGLSGNPVSTSQEPRSACGRQPPSFVPALGPFLRRIRTLAGEMASAQDQGGLFPGKGLIEPWRFYL